MSEEDVIREHIISDAEDIDGEWGCVHEWADMTPKCAGYTAAVAALAALDSLRSRLAEVERERDELRDNERVLAGKGRVADHNLTVENHALRESVVYVCRSMRRVAVDLRRAHLNHVLPVRWAPPDEEVFAGNLDFGGDDISLADLLEVFAHILDDGPLNPPQEEA